MLKLLKKRLKNEKGLTLVEVLAVVVILAIVAAIAIPAIGNIINNSEIKSAKADVANVLSAANIYFADKGETNGKTVGYTQLKDYVDTWGVLDEVKESVQVTKGSPNSLSLSDNKTITVAGKTVKISGATVDNLKIDSPDPTDSFSFTK
ncbi:prepilin-type N-terminal cleavage/methylation domain-containing protein [Ureibacillus sp. FSL W8-0352]|uniref:prepilin-type N-terminal cleavage/methylation domain-containing protein n=1 Tax=Ureibacillus sp. FSL W8-0352 TaxID=2954596 RepID=UPI0030FCAE36